MYSLRIKLTTMHFASSVERNWQKGTDTKRYKYLKKKKKEIIKLKKKKLRFMKGFQESIKRTDKG